MFFSFDVSVLSSPVEPNKDEDDYLQDTSSDDYEEEYGDEVQEKRKSSTVSSTSQTDEPYKTQEYTEKSNVGRTIVLKCLGEDLDSSSVFMWYLNTF